MEPINVVMEHDGCLYWLTVMGLGELEKLVTRFAADVVVKTVNGRKI